MTQQPADGDRDARDDAVAHWKKEVAAAREILDSCRENTNYWMEVDYKSKSAIVAEAEQLRAVMEANEKLRKQLSDQARELGVLEGKAEMWQQRAEIAEAALTQGGLP